MGNEPNLKPVVGTIKDSNGKDSDGWILDWTDGSEEAEA